MPWKYSGRIIRGGKSWVDNDGTTHPKTWQLWDSDYRVARGVTWENDPAPYDNRFYWDADTPRSLPDTLWVDSADKAVIDPKTGQQGVTPGLKSIHKSATKATAESFLSKSDWQVIKATEVSEYSVPSNISTYRAAVRTASNSIETAIDSASNINTFMALWDIPRDSANGPPTGNAPINDWPDEV